MSANDVQVIPLAHLEEDDVTAFKACQEDAEDCHEWHQSACAACACWRQRPCQSAAPYAGVAEAVVCLPHCGRTGVSQRGCDVQRATHNVHGAGMVEKAEGVGVFVPTFYLV